jgi:putative ABC transport system permease protein
VIRGNPWLKMNSFGFIRASLRHYRRIHVAVALGVAVATAVLTGALLVGDSVRGSLLELTLQRLGGIDSALVSQAMFREALAEELAADAGYKQHFIAAEPAIVMTGTLQSGRGQWLRPSTFRTYDRLGRVRSSSGESLRRSTDVSIIGCRPTFWSLGKGGPQRPFSQNEIALTEALARELEVEAGESILLRIPVSGAIPADSPLGEKSETALSRWVKVAAVLPADGLARFRLAPSQHLPRNAFVPLETLQDLLEQPDKVNVVLVATQDSNTSSGDSGQRALQKALKPQLEDYGLRVERIESPTECLQISAGQLVLPNAVVRAAEKAFSDPSLQPIVTYLANTLSAGSGESPRKIPYSTITGVESTAALGPLLDEAGQPILLTNDEIALNRWAADDLNVKVGDTITVTFYEPESTHGRLRERNPPPHFKLAAIVELKNSAGQPTPAADPKLTPELPGVTDQESINDWELPFDLVEKIRSQDEAYWDEYHTTPKAFISLASAARLWPSRWGTISLVRLPNTASDGETASAPGKITAQLLKALDPASMGMSFLPVKEQGLAAARGTTPFDWLFLGFSFFLMASAVMLIAILFQLGVEQRARELGTLAAVGVGRRKTVRLVGCEGLVVSTVGAALGVMAGILYAWLMITLLRTWWVAAIATPFLELHITPRSLIIGWIIGVAVSWLAILWSIRRLARQPTNRLLSGSTAGDGHRAEVVVGSPHKWRNRMSWPIARVAMLLSIIVLLLLSFQLEGEAQAGVFFATGAMVLALTLGEVRHRLRRGVQRAAARHAFSLPALSSLNMARNPARSTLTIGLVAAASFLIIAISAFRLETGEAGTGGFDLLATSDLPLYYDLNTPEGRLELGVSDRPRQNQKLSDDQALSAWGFYSFRVADGEDASCLNLYRPTQPRVLGAPDAFIERGGFAWAGAADAPSSPPSEGSARRGATENPWKLLQTSLSTHETGEVIPVVLDASTAIYSLHLSGVGDRLTIRDAAGEPITLQVVGLLKNSVLQGNLLVSEANFLRLFPDTGGYRFFLIENRSRHAPRAVADRGKPTADGLVKFGEPPDASDRTRSVAATLETTLSEEGFDAVDAREQLAQFLAVQNTYLSTFQSLGALGLLLGTIGLAVVQLRSVIERQAELALMRAAGFRGGRLTRMIVWENGVLLLGGLAVGLIAAAVTLVPQSMLQEAGVPWRTLALLLGIIGAVGLAAAWLATRSALQRPILPALRGD